MSGGAPLKKEVMDFFKVAVCPMFVEAYGQTEGCGGEFFTIGFETTQGTVGRCSDVCEMKLVDVPEMNYLSTDTDENGNPEPRGEIWVRGPSIIKEYYK